MARTRKAATARKPARKAAKPRSLGGRIAKAVESVLDTLSEAERLHARTMHKAGFQELE